MNETWKPVVDYETRYEVSDLGRVRNSRTLKVLRPGRQSRGYLTVLLYNGEKPAKSFTVHRLVAGAFIGDPGDRQVNHIDGIKTNNRLENLEYVTGQENVQHALKNGLVTIRTKLTADDVLLMCFDMAVGMSYSEAGRKYGITHGHARAIYLDRYWKHWPIAG